MIDQAITELVQYGLDTGLVAPEDKIFVTNQILEALGLESYEETPGSRGAEELEQILKLEEVTGVSVYQYNGGRHDDLPRGNSWVYAVQFQAGSEGWNCTSCNTVLYWSLPYSYKQAEQAAGRIDRLDTSYKTLNYYIMRSFAPLDLGIIRALRNKEDFNASGFLRSSARQKE